jgi:hypothetical protein
VTNKAVLLNWVWKASGTGLSCGQCGDLRAGPRAPSSKGPGAWLYGIAGQSPAHPCVPPAPCMLVVHVSEVLRSPEYFPGYAADRSPPPVPLTYAFPGNTVATCPLPHPTGAGVCIPYCKLVCITPPQALCWLPQTTKRFSILVVGAGMVVHACNPNYLGGKDKKIVV